MATTNTFPSSFKLETAIADSTKLDLSCKHITTANWMQLNPVFWKEMVPGEKLEVGIETFTRLNPLIVPTFAPGSKLKTHRFFVPFRTIFRGWNDFITDSLHIPSSTVNKNAQIPVSVPIVRSNTLLAAFISIGLIMGDSSMIGGHFAEEVSGNTAYDFTVRTGAHYRYTRVGAQAKKVIESLGYKLNPDATDEQEYSALPLLAFAKVFMDYFWPVQYRNAYLYNYIYSLFNIDTGDVYELTASDVCMLLNACIYVMYNSDYFTSAFDNPMAPSNGNFSQMNLNDYTFAGGSGPYLTVQSVTSNGTPIVKQSLATNTTVLTQYADSMLHRLTDYMRRHQLSSSAFDRYLARFGKSLDADKMNRAIYLGCDSTTIQIGDVMSTADTVKDTEGAQLGSYAGKGAAYSRNDYDGFSTDEYGIYIITASLIPDVFYDQGIDPNILHVYRSEYWTPEFDYGIQSITADMIYMSNNALSDWCSNSGAVHDQVFGFTPRYSEYRTIKSRLTGNFTVPSLNGNSELATDAWHMERKFDDTSFGGALSACVHSLNFVTGINDAGDYNRMFYNDDNNAPDQFITIYNFDVTSYSPMSSLYDNYEWSDEQSGRKIDITNGVRLN